MLHVLQSTAARASQSIGTVSRPGCWTAWTAALQKLSQILADFRASARPILAYRVSQLSDMATEIKLVLL